MKNLGKFNLMIVAASAVVGLVAAVSLLLDAAEVAIFCTVILLEGLVVLAVLNRRSQKTVTDAVAAQSRDVAALVAAIDKVDRRVANVAERTVTEARATEQSLIAVLKGR